MHTVTAPPTTYRDVIFMNVIKCCHYTRAALISLNKLYLSGSYFFEQAVCERFLFEGGYYSSKYGTRINNWIYGTTSFPFFPHTHTHTRVCAHVHTHAHTHTHIHTHVHTYAHTHAHTNTHTQTHTNTLTNTHTRTHTHTHTPQGSHIPSDCGE